LFYNLDVNVKSMHVQGDDLEQNPKTLPALYKTLIY